VQKKKRRRGRQIGILRREKRVSGILGNKLREKGLKQGADKKKTGTGRKNGDPEERRINSWDTNHFERQYNPYLWKEAGRGRSVEHREASRIPIQKHARRNIDY